MRSTMRTILATGARWFAVLLLFGGTLAPGFAAGAQGALIITRPQHDETIHDNSGTVPVAVSLQGVSLGGGARLRVLLDGKPSGADREGLIFTLDNVERGTHALQVQLINEKQGMVAESPVVTFHLWQASALLPSRKPPPPLPKK
jgi:hypothetical protein